MDSVEVMVGITSSLQVSNVVANLARLMRTKPAEISVFGPDGARLGDTTPLKDSHFIHQTLTWSGTSTSPPLEEDVESWRINFDRYEEIRSLGRGGYGSVSLMRDPMTDRQVAVKSLCGSGPDVTKGFKREIKALVDLNHPCIHSIVGWDEDPGDTHVIRVGTEHMENGSLLSVMQKAFGVPTPPPNPPGIWNPTGIAIMTAGIVMGMRYLHRKGMIHRDLKPGNILIDHDGYAVVADLGTCRDAGRMQMTKGIGTPLYLAPELFNDEHYDTTVDIYAFALILWEMTTQQLLEYTHYKGKTITGIGAKMAAGDRPTFPRGFYPEIQRLIEKGWENDPSERPTFDDIFNELQACKFRIMPGVDSDRVDQFVRRITELEVACAF